jgi:hypothetical protein
VATDAEGDLSAQSALTSSPKPPHREYPAVVANDQMGDHLLPLWLMFDLGTRPELTPIRHHAEQIVDSPQPQTVPRALAEGALPRYHQHLFAAGPYRHRQRRGRRG